MTTLDREVDALKRVRATLEALGFHESGHIEEAEVVAEMQKLYDDLFRDAAALAQQPAKEGRLRELLNYHLDDLAPPPAERKGGES